MKPINDEKHRHRILSVHSTAIRAVAEYLQICKKLLSQTTLASYIPSGMRHWTTQAERHAKATSYANDLDMLKTLV